jgi:hypothetical protein
VRDAYPRAADTVSAEAAIAGLVERYGLTPVMQAITIHQRWSEIVGAQIGRVSRPDSLFDGVLAVWVRTSTWMQELRLLAPTLVSKINAAIGTPVVRELRLHFGAARARPATTICWPATWRRAAGGSARRGAPRSPRHLSAPTRSPPSARRSTIPSCAR